MVQAKHAIQLIGLLIICFLTVRVLGGSEPWFLGNINLIFHEAGHPLFGLVFGNYIGAWGGTIMQLLVPGVLAVYFFMRREVYSASILLWWLGENLIGISIYVSDASAQLLPLLGGEAVTHDWGYILGRAGLLDKDQFIGDIVSALGAGIMITALVIAFVVSVPAVKNKLLEYVAK